MATEKKVYKNPQAGTPLISTICTNCETPWLEVKFCNLVKPYRYPNSPTIPRYSVTCMASPDEHKEFIKGIQSIEKDEGVETIIKYETMKEDGKQVLSGNLLVKFQNKEIIPIFLAGNFPKGETPTIELEDELAKGEKIKIFYDILRYTKKNTMKTEHGLSFKPTRIYYDQKGEF